MLQIQIQMAGLPFVLVLRSNRTLAIVPVQAFMGIWDECSSVRAGFWPDEFQMTSSDGRVVESYFYNTLVRADECPLLIEWLKTLNLQLPLE